MALKGAVEREGVKMYGGCWLFVALVCIRVYFHCCCEGYLCQGLQGAGGVNSKLVSGW
jgi:hypothetical protein